MNKEEKDKIVNDIDRIIYMWRRYEGKRTKEGKCFSFSDIDELENRIGLYFKNPEFFDWNNGEVKCVN